MKNVLIYKEFIGSVNFSADDNVFFGKIEGINDLVTFEGTSVQELREAFEYMVDEHIKDCEKEGIPLIKSYRGNLNIRLNPETHKEASLKSIMKGISLNQFIQNAVEKAISEKR